MEVKAVVLFMGLLFGFVAGSQNNTEVKLSNFWKQDVGWVVMCNWTLLSNDSLQSVRLYNNDQQFMIYRPQVDGESSSQIFRPIKDVMQVDCTETEPRGVKGSCIMTIELYQPQRDSFSLMCEVSGERPKFRIDRKDIVVHPYVPPTEAMIGRASKDEVTGRVVLNCTSSGMPAPTLVWTVGDQKVPHDFKSSNHWNVTSKLWHVWSQMSYTPSREQPGAVCTPESSRGREVEKGSPAYYNSGSLITENTLFAAAILLLLS